MAIQTPIMAPDFPEASSAFTHTPVTHHFAKLMRDIAAYIEAERDLDHCASWDPACDAWIRDAERVRTRVLGDLATLYATPLERHEDQPLKRLGQTAQMLIESDSPEQVRDILSLPDRFPRAFHCAGSSAVSRRVNLMVAAFRQHLNALATLKDVTGMDDASDLTIEHGTSDQMLAPAA